MAPTRAIVAIWLLVGVCLVGVAGGVATVGASEHDADGDTQHEHPDDVGDDGNLTAVQRWLGDRMTRVHIDCAQNVTLAESAACDRLNGDYPEYLSEYATVEQERTGGTNTSDTYKQTRKEQQELAEEYQEYNETYEEYKKAREAGDEERALELSRELQDSSMRILELSQSLNDLFARLEEATGRDYTPAREAIAELAAEVANTTTNVEGEVFTPTNLTAEIDADSATFSEPATVQGTLTDENGTALADREIAIVVDTRTVATARTDEDGGYEASYRPVTAATGETTVEAIYEPDAEEAYLRSNATAAVDIEAIEPGLSIETDAESVAFGDTVSVTAAVTADNTAAKQVLVVLLLGDEPIAEAETDQDGQVELEGTVPATVPDGDREIRVRASRDGTALSPVTESQSVEVLETETELTIEGLLDQDTLVLSGRLTTADGRPVPGQEVGVNVDGEIRRMGLTNDEGRYEVEVPRDTSPTDRYSVSADYSNPDSNLAPTTTTRTLRAEDLNTTAGTTVREGGTVERVESIVDNNRIPSAIAAVVIGLAISGAIGKRYFDKESGPDGDDPAPVINDDSADGPSDGQTTEDGMPVDEPSEPESDIDDPIAVAREYLESGSPSEAVRFGYGAVRSELLRQMGSTDRDTLTHWEFYDDVRSELADSSDALETLTEAYERAAFAPSGIDEPTAQSAVDAAAECLQDPSATDGGRDDTATDGGTDDGS